MAKQKSKAPSTIVARKKTPAKTKPKIEQPKQHNSVQNAQHQQQRIDPRHRGIHDDAIQAGKAPTGAASCVACDKRIDKNQPRWGIKYAGNPLPATIPVIPLYGSHPMVMWCHGGSGCCGLAFVRYRDMESEAPAVRTCHACQDAPDEHETSNTDNKHNSIRLLCGGSPKGRKIRHHVFHISCWIRSIQKSAAIALHEKLLVKPQDITSVPPKTKNQKQAFRGLSWVDLTQNERELVCEEFRRMGVDSN